MKKHYERFIKGGVSCVPYMLSLGLTIVIGYKSVTSLILNAELLALGIYASGLVTEKLNK